MPRFGSTVAAAFFLAAPLLATPPLAQLPGTAGCLNDDGNGGCGAGAVALGGATGVAVSPDGRNVYITARSVTSVNDGGVAVFDVDLGSGALTQKAASDGCLSQLGTGCEDGRGLVEPRGIAVSPDGHNVYVVSFESEAIVIIDRDPSTGALQQKAGTAGCISENGSGGDCFDGSHLGGATGVVVSPDGRDVYVTSSNHNLVLRFQRDPLTGDLSSPVMFDSIENATEIAISPDGRNLYVVGEGRDILEILTRDPATGSLTQAGDASKCWSEDGSKLGTPGECMDGRALNGPRGVTVSHDGRNVYVASFGSDGVAIFDRDPATGALTQKAGTEGCKTLAGGDCGVGIALEEAVSVAVSDDGESVYVGAQGSSAVAVFDRDRTTGALAQKESGAGCVSSAAVGCLFGRGISGPSGVAVGPGSDAVYVTGFLNNSIAIFDRDVPPYDIDGDGEHLPLTDGVLMERGLFGFTGEALVTDAVDEGDCTRCTAEEIEAYLTGLVP